MKINVNEYNEILSYEGTPEELAEFVATGILDPYMRYYEECEYEDEPEIIEESDESVIVPDAMDEDIVEETSEENSKTPVYESVEEYKRKIKEDLIENGLEFTDEEFEDAFDITVAITKTLKDFFE